MLLEGCLDGHLTLKLGRQVMFVLMACNPLLFFVCVVGFTENQRNELFSLPILRHCGRSIFDGLELPGPAMAKPCDARLGVGAQLGSAVCSLADSNSIASGHSRSSSCKRAHGAGEGCFHRFGSLARRASRVARLVVRSQNPTASPYLDYKPLGNSEDIQVGASAGRWQVSRYCR